MEAILDTREHVLRSLLPNLKVEQLDIGDVLIRNNEGVMVSIERKTITDLAASIQDGRWTEQRCRTLSAVENDYKRIIYIVEGFPSWCVDENRMVGSMKIKALRTALIRVQLDGCGVYTTSGTEETARLITRLISVINEHGIERRNVAYLDCVRVKKSSNMNADAIGKLNLCNISGITASAAEAVYKEFGVGTIVGLYKSYCELGHDKWIARAADITRNGRRLGPAKANDIATLVLAG